MKKFLAIILASLMILSLVSCGGETVSQQPIVEEPQKKIEVPVVVITGNTADGKDGVVASENEKASKAGLDVLKKGGNAVDAAVAMAYTLAVTDGEKGGLGGGGYMLIYKAEDKSVSVIDYIETAPKEATPQMWLDIDGKVAENEKGLLSQYSGMASGVPGFVAGMETAFENFGSTLLTRKDLIKYAVSEAEENADLKSVLETIGDNGKMGFYSGIVAEAIVNALKESDGVMTVGDLSSYKAEIYTADTSTYNGYNIYANSDESIEVLNILDNFDMKDVQINSSEYIHLLAESFKIAAADRMTEMDVTDKDICIDFAAKITDMSGTFGSNDVYAEESNNGSAFVVIDSLGNMVACVNSIGDFGGSGLSAMGISLNNAMNKFNKDEKNANAVVALKRIPTSNTVAFVLDENNNPIDVIACAGGIRSYMTVAQILSRTLSGMKLNEAVNTSRISDGVGRIYYETAHSSNPIVNEYVTELQAMGHFTTDAKDDALYFGSVAAATKTNDGLISVIDHRLENGKALGY